MWIVTIKGDDEVLDVRLIEAWNNEGGWEKVEGARQREGIIVGDLQKQHGKGSVKGRDELPVKQGEKENSTGNPAHKNNQRNKAQIKKCGPKSLPQ